MIPRFCSTMKWEDVPDSDYKVVTENCTYQLTEIAHVTVPRGFFTDLASVPPPFNNLYPANGKYAAAAVLHDFLCEYLSITIKGKPTCITRRIADDIFMDAMFQLGVNTSEVRVLYESVVTYRILCGKDKPSTTRAKRDLEAKWWKNNVLYPRS